MLNMLILEVLKQYSDEAHPLTQQEILRRLKEDYDMDCDRRSVKSNIVSLQEMGYEIAEENGYYLAEREFEEAELRMLIDSVLFSKTLTETQARGLIEKLESFGNRYFKSGISHVAMAGGMNRSENKQTWYVLDAINEAIEQNKKITFQYTSYGTDFRRHSRPHEYVMNPYQLVAANGNYYLMGNMDKYDTISYYRIDRMANVQLLEETRKPSEQVKGMERGLDLPKHMAEHVYMFSGESVSITLKTTPGTMDALVDWFGRNFRILEEKDDSMLVRLRCNENAMFYWALQYGPYVEVLEPASLRARLAETTAAMDEKYHQNRQ